MVTDTLILSRVADASIYVCRADYTHKTDYQLINELQEHHRLPQLMHSSQRNRYEEAKNTVITTAMVNTESITATVRNTDTVELATSY